MIGFGRRQPHESAPFAEVRAALERVSRLSVAARVGALALIPENGQRLGRLGELAVLAGEASDGDRPPISRGQLAGLLNGGVLGARGSQRDDPFDDVLVEEVAAPGGRRLIGAGLAENSIYILRLVMAGVLSHPDLDDGVRDDLIDTVRASLALSDHVLRDAGLSRNQAPAPAQSGIVVPGGDRLAALAAAAVFSPEKLARAVGTRGAEALRPLIRSGDRNALDDEQVMDGVGDQWPFVQVGDDLVMTQPFCVAMALRHQILVRAVADLGQDEVRLGFGRVVDNDVRLSLLRLGIPAKVTSPRTVEQGWSIIGADLDRDVELCCLVATDSMEDVGGLGPYGMYSSAWLNPAEGIFKQAAQRTSKQVLGLMVPQGAGRGSSFGMRDIDAQNLTTCMWNAADLAIFALLEQGDPLALWKFSRESHDLHSATRVMDFSTLDLYAIYRDHSRTLRPLHEATLVTIQPGSGAELRREAKSELDRHAAFYVDGTVREIEHDDIEPYDTRLYRTSEVREGRIVRYIAGAPVDLWVLGPEGTHAADLMDVVETIAFWLAELSAPLAECWQSLATQVPCFAVALEVVDPEHWFTGKEPSREARDYEPHELRGLGVGLRLGSDLREQVASADNAGERALISRLLDAIDDFLDSRALSGLDDETKAVTLEAVAPLGIKKHLLVMPADGNELSERADGSARRVEEADLTAVRGELGEFLIATHGLARGERVPDAKRREVLRSGVSHLLDELRAELGRLAPDDVLEQLTIENERISGESEHARAILPARAATYPRAVTHDRLRDESARFNQAGICCRFLIECAVAEPPAGQEPWSTRRYDRLMALCAEMIDWAYLDDAFHYEMSDNGLLINSEGELRLVELDRYQVGRANHFDRHIEDQRRLATARFARRFGVEEAPQASSILERIDPLMELEAGASLSELFDLAHTAWSYARGRDVDVVVLERDAAEHLFAEELSWSQEKVSAVLTYLSMGHREDLLSPPTGTRSDVIPSRFSRRWSLNRRPFLIRGDEVVWGRRQVLAAIRIISGQISSGRFQDLAETEALHDEVSAIASEAGRRFEQEVANAIREGGFTDLVESVTRLAGVPLERANGEDLGDIDVLVALPAKRVLFGIECKDLAGALTPTEVAGELAEHFDDSEGTSTQKHSERIAWLRDHQAEALSELGIDDDPSLWTAEGLIVTAMPVLAPYISNVRFEIVDLNRLPGWLDVAVPKEVAAPRPTNTRRRRRRR